MSEAETFNQATLTSGLEKENRRALLLFLSMFPYEYMKNYKVLMEASKCVERVIGQLQSMYLRKDFVFETLSDV